MALRRRETFRAVVSPPLLQCRVSRVGRPSSGLTEMRVGVRIKKKERIWMGVAIL